MMAEAKKMMESPEFKKQMKKLADSKEFKDGAQKTGEYQTHLEIFCT
jgi:tripartite-type tricarboxylate transporter receptor subunit TctC